ncbi:MAG: hypothetical protein JST82_03720 [Bacteroidetes bacterium]|nr:hypothetical protein [Bacteroidota bacterium]
MRGLLLYFLIGISVFAHAQEDVPGKADGKVKGFVKQMHVLKYMVWMENDSIKYGEKRRDETYFYDEDMRITMSYSRPEYSKDTTFYYRQYNAAGELTATTTKRASFGSFMDVAYKYENGKLSADSMIYYIAKKKKFIINHYVYYKDSMEQYRLDSAGVKQSSKIYYYDDKANVIRIKNYAYSLSGPVEAFEYDMFNNIVSSTVYSDKGTDDVYTYEYEYDDRRNVIKCTEYKNKNIYSITTRKITYR